MASLSSEGEDVSFTVLFSSTEQLIRDGNGFGGDTDSALPSSRPVREKREYVNREGSFVTGFDVSTEVCKPGGVWKAVHVTGDCYGDRKNSKRN